MEGLIMHVEATVIIRSDTDEVFEFIAAPENGPRWQEGAISTRVTTPGPVGVGSQIEHVGRWMGMRLPTRAEVTLFEHGARFGYDITTAMSPSPSQMRYSLVQVADGTRLTLSNDFTLPGYMRLFAPVLRRSVQRMFERDVRRLRDLVESGAGVTHGQP
jgi:hypothetical protein